MNQKYVNSPGDVVGVPPYVAKDCLMHSLFVKGDRKHLQRLCDLVLNEPTNNAFAFSVMTDWVLLTSIYCESMGSGDPLHKSKGVVAEVDIGLWTLVSGLEETGGKNRKLYWLPSYLFVDSAAAMAAGREVFGYPKTVGKIERGSSLDADASVDVKIWHFRKFAPDERPVEETVLKIVDAGETETPSSADGELLDHLGRFIPKTAFGNGHLPLPDAGMPQILLQQIRDAERPHFTSLKEIVCVSPKPTKIEEGGLIGKNYLLRLSDSASHPIARTMGLKAENQACGGIWLKYDFAVGLGRKIWTSQNTA